MTYILKNDSFFALDVYILVCVFVPIVKNTSDRKAVESKQNTSQLLIHFREYRFVKKFRYEPHKRLL